MKIAKVTFETSKRHSTLRSRPELYYWMRIRPFSHQAAKSLLKIYRDYLIPKQLIYGNNQNHI